MKSWFVWRFCKVYKYIGLKTQFLGTISVPFSQLLSPSPLLFSHWSSSPISHQNRPSTVPPLCMFSNHHDESRSVPSPKKRSRSGEEHRRPIELPREHRGSPKIEGKVRRKPRRSFWSPELWRAVTFLSELWLTWFLWHRIASEEYYKSVKYCGQIPPGRTSLELC